MPEIYTLTLIVSGMNCQVLLRKVRHVYLFLFGNTRNDFASIAFPKFIDLNQVAKSKSMRHIYEEINGKFLQFVYFTTLENR